MIEGDLTIEELSAHLKIKPDTVAKVSCGYEQTRRRKIPSYRIPTLRSGICSLPKTFVFLGTFAAALQGVAVPNLPSDELRLEIASIVRNVIRNELAAHKTEIDEPLLTAEELADRLRIPVSWVYEASRRGDIPTVRIGRYIRFHLSEVLASEAAKLTKQGKGEK